MPFASIHPTSSGVTTDNSSFRDNDGGIREADDIAVGGGAPATASGACVRQSDSSSGGGGGDARFACSICLETVSDEPVVTRCGHLYCWPCLYRWLEPGMLRYEYVAAFGTTGAASGGGGARINGDARRKCPMCKAECTVDSVIPIYVNVQQQHQEAHATKLEVGKAEENDSKVPAALSPDVNEEGGSEGERRAGLSFESPSSAPASPIYSAAESRAATTRRDSENRNDRVETQDDAPATAAAAAAAVSEFDIPSIDISAIDNVSGNGNACEDTDAQTGLRLRRRSRRTPSAHEENLSPERCGSSSMAAATTVTPVIRNGYFRNASVSVDGDGAIPARPAPSPNRQLRESEAPAPPGLLPASNFGGGPTLRPRHQQPPPAVSYGYNRNQPPRQPLAGAYGRGGGAVAILEGFARGIDQLAAASQHRHHRRGGGVGEYPNDGSHRGEGGGGGGAAAAPVPVLHRGDGVLRGIRRASEERPRRHQQRQQQIGVNVPGDAYGTSSSPSLALPLQPFMEMMREDDLSLTTARDFLSRLLLMLACFVILCLLLF